MQSLPKINVVFRQDKEVPQIAGDMYFDIQEVSQIELTKGEPFISTVTLEYAENENRYLDVHHFLLGRIEPTSRILECPEEYGIVFPEEIQTEKIAVYTTPTGKKFVREYDNHTHVFEESSDMVAAALDFVSSCLEIRNQFASDDKKMCKTNGNN